MTREEADQLIVECEQLAGELAVIGRVEQVTFEAEMKSDGFEVAGVICNNAKTMAQASDRMQRLMSLARLGASVAAPRDDEIEAMAKAAFEHNNGPYGFCSENGRAALHEEIRAALSALRESKP